MTSEPSGYVGDEWVAERFGDVGTPPDNAVEVDPDAELSPNVERPCGEGVPADGD